MLMRLLLLSIVCISGAENSVTGVSKPNTKLITLADQVTYEITQRITVTNGDVSGLDLLELNLPIPLSWPEQTVTRIKTIGDDTFELQDVNELGLIVRSLYRDTRSLPKPGDSRSK